MYPITRESVMAPISSNVAEKAVCWCDGRKKRNRRILRRLTHLAVGGRVIGGVATGKPISSWGADLVLHVIDDVLLVVWVIENVESLRPEAQLVALPQMEDSRNTKIDIFECRAAEGIELLARDDREVHLRVVEDCSVGAAAGQSNDTAEFEIFQRAKLGKPHPGRHKAMSLIELRRPALQNFEFSS